VLIPHRTLHQIAAGDVDTVLRRWKRPTVKAGGRLRTVVGELAIDSVEVIDEAELSDHDARRAGHASREDALAAMAGREGSLYRVRVRFDGHDRRADLRNQADLSDDDWLALDARLARMDRSSSIGPWTQQALDLIAEQPAVRAPDLAIQVGSETAPFKARIRRLKELGLTESLEVGYRLSPRGEAYRRWRQGRLT
jgi:hypothetical protein